MFKAMVYNKDVIDVVLVFLSLMFFTPFSTVSIVFFEQFTFSIINLLVVIRKGFLFFLMTV